MVTRLRLTPGHMAMHWAKPMTRAIFQVSSASGRPSSRGRPRHFRHQLTTRIARPPTNQAATTGQVPNR